MTLMQEKRLWQVKYPVAGGLVIEYFSKREIARRFKQRMKGWLRPGPDHKAYEGGAK